jgi:hypothetical protein
VVVFVLPKNKKTAHALHPQSQDLTINMRNVLCIGVSVFILGRFAGHTPDVSMLDTSIHLIAFFYLFITYIIVAEHQ